MAKKAYSNRYEQNPVRAVTAALRVWSVDFLLSEAPNRSTVRDHVHHFEEMGLIKPRDCGTAPSVLTNDVVEAVQLNCIQETTTPH